MKKFYLIATAVTMLTACTNSEKMTADFSNDDPVMIGFETFHEKSTKASVGAPSGLTDGNGGFGVYGFKHKDDKTASEGSIDLSDQDQTNENFVTPIFQNVKVWYVDGADTKDFTYAVPKYWDKKKFYTFFAYAPYAQEAVDAVPDNPSTTDVNESVPATKGIKFNQATGKFTRNDIKALQEANPTSPSTVSVTVGYESAQSRNQYSTAYENGIIDYLIAPYVPHQKSGLTNQSENTYDGKEYTVGFNFYHILSKLDVIVTAKDEKGDGKHGYSGVKSIKVTKLNITNLPNSSSNDVTYQQTNVEYSTGTFTESSYTSQLNIISGEGATSTSELYILDGGNESSGTITKPASYINQAFHYYVAPNTPATGNKHEINIDYTITYVDGTIEPYSRTIDLSDATKLTSGSATLTSMTQNNVYRIIVTIGLDQIYFTVNNVEGWTTPINTEIKEIEL